MNDLTPLLQELATKLNVTIDHLWQVLIYQAHIFTIEYFAWAILFIILLIITVKYAKWIPEFDFTVLHALGIGIFIFLDFIIFMSLLINFGDLLSALLNPEYYALKQILSYIK